MTFAMTPISGFPAPSDDGFPRVMQFQENGVDVGDTSITTVNFTGNVQMSLSSDGTILTIDIGPVP